MMDTKRQRFERRLGELKTLASGIQPRWKELSEFIAPWAYQNFLTDEERAKRKPSRIIDGTATASAGTLASGLASGITPRSRPWVQLRAKDPDLNKFKPVKAYLDYVGQAMSEVFLKSNLYTTLNATYSDLGTFATNAFAVIEGNEPGSMWCYHFPIGTYYLGVNHQGVVDTVYREYQMSVSQLVRRFGRENCSNQVRNYWDTSRYDVKIPIVYLVEPNPEFDPAKPASKFKKFASVYYEVGCKEQDFLSERGFDEFPIMAPRWMVSGGDAYGSACPGMISLGDVQQLQMLHKRKMQGLERAINPPVNAPVSMRNVGASTLPGGVNWVNDGQPNSGVQAAMAINPYLNDIRAEIQETHERIRKFFFEDLFLMMANEDRSNITAFEIQIRQEEKVMALGPVLERLNDELLDPLVSRTLRLMERGGLIPPPPPELEGSDPIPEYISTLAQAQKLSSVNGIMAVTQFAANMATFDPAAMKKVDALFAIDEYADAVGSPAAMLRSNDQVNKMVQADQEAAALSQNMVAAQQAADTALTLSQTQTDTPSALQQIQQMFGGGAA